MNAETEDTTGPVIPEHADGVGSWVEFAKRQKMHAVASMQRGDIPPTVIVERGGRVQAIVIAPQVDKHLGLQAAAMCQAGYDPDAITMVLDAHIGTMSTGTRPDGEKMTEEEIEQATAEWRKKYPKGMQHACDNEDACATGDITDCLICHRIDRDGKITMVTLPYAYHGKEGPPFKWLDQDPRYKDMAEKPMSELKGLIPDALREIMSTGNLIEKIPTIKEMAAHFADFSEERIRFHIARVIISLLSARKFMIMDFLSGTHPEWTGAKEDANDMLSKMVETGFVPKEAHEPMKEIIDNHIGTLAFREKMTALLTANGYWLPGEVRSDIERFVYEFEAICMSPKAPPGFGNDDEENEGPPSPTAKAEGKRVRVWNGDRSEYLGEGNYVGNVNVYFIQMPDGSLQSNGNAEVEPTDVPEGGVVRKAGKNPKIVLDNGQTVYGCQVWWEPVEEEASPAGAKATAASPHQHGPHCKHNKA
jgi:hypothetical protein